ncbi:MAG: DUF5916 domain-containing protein [Saprospiraceae bacterium]|nr:DUF5916 domain-containing protein [Saprospiraceae bacterium]
MAYPAPYLHAMQYRVGLAVLCLLIVLPAWGQPELLRNPADGPEPMKRYTTARTDTPPVIDGDLSDPAWETVDWGSGFTQLQPHDGAKPTQETKFKILYDDHHLYIGYRCYDTHPDSIVSRMSRRDGFAGDWIEINIDSYHDKRTAFSFTASVSGVKGDEFVTNDGQNWDTSWDPIWTTRSQIDDEGWTCEVAIPLSQLRYSGEEEQVWGIQFTRRDFRNESRSVWRYVPRNAGYWVSGFGELHGLRGLQAKRQVEIQPYVLAQLETFKKEPGNPFADGSDGNVAVGVDGKIGLTSDITLDFTVNPDFGQVEADPSALTLDGFQIFFNERRPFFIENRGLFSYNISNSTAGGPYDIDNLFYSRRIGARPHRFVGSDPGSGFYSDQPEFTTILGAAKVSGKTKSGLSLGVMEAVTGREHATINVSGEESREVVEPQTNYFVGRVSQDFNEGSTIIGGIFTHVGRKIDDPSLEFLHKSALSGGIDVIHRWKDKAWQFHARFVTSRVAGTAEAIRTTQTAFEHAFTRPGADHLDYDPTVTELIGHGGNISIGERKGEFNFQTGVTWRSPKLELNDIGFMRNSDEINYYYWMGFRENDPVGKFRSYSINYNHWWRWDFGGNNLFRAFNVNMNGNLKNHWNFGTGVTYENLDISNNWLRGGPSYRRPSGVAHWFWVNSDGRKVVSAFVNVVQAYGFENKVHYHSLNTDLRIQPSDALNLSFGPSWTRTNRDDQYVTSRRDLFDQPVYILGEVIQETLGITFRVNYNITPDLTIQYYGQPFISRGTYSNFNFVLDPLAKDFDQRVAFFAEDQVSYEDETYSIDTNRDGQIDYTFGDPDFNFVQFRSNLVARWEYIPGSEIFVVWTQGNTFFGRPEDGLIGSLTDNIFSDALRNTFLVKFTYRFLNR